MARVKVTPFLVANLFVSSTEVVQQVQLRPMWCGVAGVDEKKLDHMDFLRILPW